MDAAVDGGGESVASCSCETALNDNGRIHVCTGSFDRSTCRSFSCDVGAPRSGRCPDRQVLLCCTMSARHLYSHLYDDCEHPNCEAGFRAQCDDFGGTVTAGACQAPELPDDPDTEVGTSCALQPPGTSNGSPLPWSLLFGLLCLGARRRTRSIRPSAQSSSVR
jgi:hypothetical protein